MGTLTIKKPKFDNLDKTTVVSVAILENLISDWIDREVDPKLVKAEVLLRTLEKIALDDKGTAGTLARLTIKELGLDKEIESNSLEI